MSKAFYKTGEVHDQLNEELSKCLSETYESIGLKGTIKHAYCQNNSNNYPVGTYEILVA